MSHYERIGRGQYRDQDTGELSRRAFVLAWPDGSETACESVGDDGSCRCLDCGAPCGADEFVCRRCAEPRVGRYQYVGGSSLRCADCGAACGWDDTRCPNCGVKLFELGKAGA